MITEREIRWLIEAYTWQCELVRSNGETARFYGMLAAASRPRGSGVPFEGFPFIGKNVTVILAMPGAPPASPGDRIIATRGGLQKNLIVRDINRLDFKVEYICEEST